MTPRLLALALTGAAGLALVTPSAALAASHAPHSAPAAHAAKSVPTAHGHDRAARAPKDKLAGPRKGAAHDLAAVTARVNRTAAAERDSRVLSAADKSAVATFDAAALQALSADASAIAAATTTSGLRDVVDAARRSGDGVELVQHFVTDTAKRDSRVSRLTVDAAAVLEQEQALPEGTDTAAVDAALADLAEDLTHAMAGLLTADSAVLALPVAPSKTELRTAKSTSSTALGQAKAALDAAELDLDEARTALEAAEAAGPAATPDSPEPTDPAPTDPAPTDPAPTDPAPTDPAPTT